MQVMKKDFEMYYSTLNPSKNLIWINSLDFVTISARYKFKTFKFILSLPQLCVLLLYDRTQSYTPNTNILTLTQMSSIINMDEFELKKHIFNMCKPHTQILSCTQVKNETFYSLNENFTSKNDVIRLCPLKMPLDTFSHRSKTFPNDNTTIFSSYTNSQKSYLIDKEILKYLKTVNQAHKLEIINHTKKSFFSKTTEDLKDSIVIDRINFLISNNFLACVSKNIYKYVP